MDFAWLAIVVVGIALAVASARDAHLMSRVKTAGDILTGCAAAAFGIARLIGGDSWPVVLLGALSVVGLVSGGITSRVAERRSRRAQ